MYRVTYLDPRGVRVRYGSTTLLDRDLAERTAEWLRRNLVEGVRVEVTR